MAGLFGDCEFCALALWPDPYLTWFPQNREYILYAVL